MTTQLDFHSSALLQRLGKDNQWIILRDKIQWHSLGQILKETDDTGSHGGRPPYSAMTMFRAVLLGAWHGVSDEELELMLKVRIDFGQFCGLSLSHNVPDHTSIQRFRAKLVDRKLLEKCMKVINQELERLGLKVDKQGTFIVDSTVIRSQARPRNIIDTDEDPPSKSTSADPDAAWTKKGKSFFYGYKEHQAVDSEGFIEHVHLTPANVHDGQELETVVNNLPEHATELGADKGYASKDNRDLLKSKNIKDSIMHKAQRNNPLTETQIKHNKKISAFRFRVEQTFGIKKLHFDFHRASYRGLSRVAGQSFLKAICVNLLKAVRKLRIPQPLAT